MKKKKKSVGEEEGKKRKKLSWKGKEEPVVKPLKADSPPKSNTEAPEPEVVKPKEGEKAQIVPKKEPKTSKKVETKTAPEEEIKTEHDTGCVLLLTIIRDFN